MNNDLISREALKKLAIPCEIHNGALTDMCVPLYQIDNAPAVNILSEIIDYIQKKKEYYANGSMCSIAERMASSYRPCRWWRSYFKRYGWKWDVIWKHAAEEHYIDITDKNDSRYNYIIISSDDEFDTEKWVEYKP